MGRLALRTIEFPPGDQTSPALELALEPAEDAEHKGLDEEPILRTLRGRSNRVQIGVPQTIDLLDGWPHGAWMAPEVDTARHDYDFLCTRMAVTFLPDRGCRFIWARLTATLAAESALGAPPIAVDMFPRQIAGQQEYRRAFKISGGMQLGFAEISADGETEKTGLAYTAQLAGGGLLTDTPSWTFESGSRQGVLGMTELFLVVKREKRRELSVRFNIAAEVQTQIGRIRLRTYRDVDRDERSYVLMPGPPA